MGISELSPENESHINTGQEICLQLVRAMCARVSSHILLTIGCLVLPGILMAPVFLNRGLPWLTFT